MEERTQALEALDEALGAIRRFWQTPGLRRKMIERLQLPVELAVYRTLRTVEALGSTPSVGDVAADMQVDASTMSRLVERAAAGGHLSREPAVEDRRRRVLRLTAAGRELLAQVRTARAQLLGEILRDWTDAEIHTLSALLDRLGQDTRTRIG